MRFTKSIRRAALLLILGSAIPALAQTATTFTVTPPSPTTDDIVIVTLSGDWPDACVPGSWGAPNVQRQPESRFTVLFPYRTGGGCAAVVTPWSLPITLGKLSAGTVEVDAAISRGLLPPEPLGSVRFTVAPPHATTFYVPAFRVPAEPSLASRLDVFNNGSGPATVTLVTAYGELGPQALGTTAHVDSGHGAAIATDEAGTGSVRFVKVAATTHLAVRAALERAVGRTPSGRVALPVFEAPITAGATSVAGAIRITEGFLRGNLTLWNAGAAPAEFTVEVVSDEGKVLATRTFGVEAETTRQFNAVVDPATFSGIVWLRITADQPYLAYASATYQGAAIPYEIYPAVTGL